MRRDVPFFIRTPPPPQDGQFLHKGGRIFKSKELPKINPPEFFSKVPQKNEPFGFFSSKGAAKTLRGRNSAIFRGSADKKWNDPNGLQTCSVSTPAADMVKSYSFSPL